MRRTLATATVALSLALTTTPALVSAAADDGARSRPSAAQTRLPGADANERATRALERAQALFAGGSVRDRGDDAGRGEGHRDATIVLRDLHSVLDDLSPAQRRQARAILARPTDGPSDPQGDGYTVASARKCGGNVCIHWVNSTEDAPPSQDWVDQMLALMNRVWNKEVGKLGYRPPISDRGRGGSNKFDVYLAQIGDDGLYGYCAPERTKPGFRYVADAYCVLDNDFAEFTPTPPMDAARATAAHEFFHAIQFGYDYLEDVWMMEATATWMEERIFDDVDDNRQYLPFGQVVQPLFPLDFFDDTSGSVYGNWAFFEFLGKNFGNGVVKSIWKKAGAYRGAPDMYSTQAVSSVVKSKGGFKKVYTRFVAANLLPAKFYPEGEHWPSTLLGRSTPFVLTKGDRRTGERGRRLLHMSSLSYAVEPAAELNGDRWRLKVKIDGPASFRMPAAHVLVHKTGGLDKYFVRLNAKGNGQVVVPFSSAKVKTVYVSLVNASTRFRCFKGYKFSCNGLPIDDGRNFAGQSYRFSASAFKR